MNIILQELKMSYKSFLYYTISMLIIFYVFLFFFNSFSENAGMLDKVLSNFPKEFKAAFGFADVNLSELNGYLSFLFSYIILIGAVYGMRLGISVLSEEIRVKTADFLLTKPIKRNRVVTDKLITVLICIVLQNIIMYGFTLLPILLIMKDNSFRIEIFTYMSFSIFLVQIFFAATGMLISVILKKIKSVMPITLGVVFMFFIIELINQSIMDEKLTYLTPFSYFKGSDIIANKGYDITYILLDFSVFAVLILLSYIFYHKRDVPSV